MEISERTQNTDWRWPLLVSVIVLNICLPSLVLSYGVLWVYLMNFEVPMWLGLVAPSLFILIYGWTQCWFREAADSWGGSVGYRVMSSIGLMLVVLSLLICAFIPYYWQPFVYGIFGGLGSSLISAQVDAILFETYDSRIGFIRGLCYTGQALGLSIFPHILYILIEFYGYAPSFIVLAGIMLQTLPTIMLLKVDETKKSSYFSRYKEFSQTFTVFKNESVEHFYGNELQLHNLSAKCWKSPSDDNLHRVEEFDDDDGNILETITPPPSPEEKRRNIFGVDILPEIPEESEEEIDDQSISKNKKRLSFAIKRLSTLGDNLDGCIINQVRRDSQCNDNKEYSELDVTYETIAPMTDIQTEKLFNSFSFRCQSTFVNMKRKLRIPSYRAYRIKRRILYLTYNVNETFFKPLRRSLSCGNFYPALLLSFTKLCLMGLGIIFLPMIGLHVKPQIAMFEINFMLTLHGFAWVCFLLCTPWLAQTPKRNFKYVAFGGLVVSTTACFVLANANGQDGFSIGCVISGLGYGAITSCWETAIQDFVGARKWPKVQSTLETLSTTFFIIFAVGISFFLNDEHDLQFTMFILGIITAIVTFVWFIIVIVSIYKSKIRTLNFRRKWWF